MYLEISSRQSGKTSRLIEQAKNFAEELCRLHGLNDINEKVIIICHNQDMKKYIIDKLRGVEIFALKVYDDRGIHYHYRSIFDCIKVFTQREIAATIIGDETKNNFLTKNGVTFTVEYYKILYDEFAFYDNNDLPINNDCYFYTTPAKSYSPQELMNCNDFFCQVLRQNNFKYI